MTNNQTPKKNKLSTRQILINDQIEIARFNVISAELELAYQESREDNKDTEVVERMNNQYDQWLPRLLFFKKMKERQMAIAEAKRSPELINVEFDR